jgi:hypothetical protein
MSEPVSKTVLSAPIVATEPIATPMASIIAPSPILEISLPLANLSLSDSKPRDPILEITIPAPPRPAANRRTRPAVAPPQPVISYSTWYKIPEIDIRIFVSLLKGLYEVLEEKNKPKSEEDVFARECWSSYYDITKEEVDEERKRVQKEKAFTMNLGYFHQDLMGSFSGWENYKKGHETGCDVGKTDGTCVAEVKNNKNTMNSSSQESVLNKLKRQKELGKRAILVIVNGGIPQKEKDGILWMSGLDFYTELSGRAEFFDDLRLTLSYVFKNYKTYSSLTTFLETL